MSLNADLREFIELLNSRGVEYVIVGAHSLAFHGRPRYTGDLDLLVRPSRENAAKLVSLLRDFGFEKGDFAEADFTVPEQMIQLGRVPTRIDLLTSISGVINRRCVSHKNIHGNGRFAGLYSEQRIVDSK